VDDDNVLVHAVGIVLRRRDRESGGHHLKYRGERPLNEHKFGVLRAVQYSFRKESTAVIF
jgi:hypothetical protein